MPKPASVRSMRARIAKRPTGSIWSQMRRTPRLSTHEMMWITRRSSPGKLIPIAKRRFPKMVVEHPRLRARSDIHTHILPAPAMHSDYDLSMILKDIQRTTIRKWHVAGVSKKGDPGGVMTFRAGKNLLRWVHQNPGKVKRLRGLLVRNHDGKMKKQSNSGDFFLKTLAFLQKRGLQVRTRARPGYVFDGKRFVRKKKKMSTQ